MYVYVFIYIQINYIYIYIYICVYMYIYNMCTRIGWKCPSAVYVCMYAQKERVCV